MKPSVPAFAKKIMNGLIPNEDDWNQYLIAVHENSPAMSPVAFGAYKTSEGLTSYAHLAQSIQHLRGSSPHVLDLACGNGHLITDLLSHLGTDARVTGVDMSEAELLIARQNFSNACPDPTTPRSICGCGSLPYGFHAHVTFRSCDSGTEAST